MREIEFGKQLSDLQPGQFRDAPTLKSTRDAKDPFQNPFLKAIQNNNVYCDKDFLKFWIISIKRNTLK